MKALQLSVVRGPSRRCGRARVRLEWLARTARWAGVNGAGGAMFSEFALRVYNPGPRAGMPPNRRADRRP